MKGLAQYLQQKTFTIHYADSLFPLDWKMLNSQRCPVCFLKLKHTLKGLYLCGSKKHKRFLLTEKQFKEITQKNATST